MGRKQFEQVVAQASRESLKQFNYEISTSLPANNGFEETLIFASNSNIGKIIGLYVDIPSVASGQTGYHDIFFSYKIPNSSINIDIAHGASGPDKQIQYQYSRWNSDIMVVMIPDNTEIGRVMQEVQFDSVVPFRIAYSNGTTAPTQAGQIRKYHVTYIEREVRL